MDNEKFVMCQCSTHALGISTDEHYAYLALWLYGRHQVPFWGRFKHIWKLLKGECPLVDDIVLDEEGAGAVIEALDRWLHGLAAKREGDDDAS